MPLDEHAERIDALMKAEDAFPAPEGVRRAANLQNYAEVYRRSIEDSDGFWGEVAEDLEWYERWKRVREVKLPHHRWFVGAKLNVTVNALDRHARGPRRNKVAFLWVGETGEERVFTYGRLLREVSKIANGLRSLGVKKGDRVLLYMPLTPEGMMTMLACARIGAIHSVVYAGMGAGAIRSRLEDSQARVVVCADVGRRRGKDVELKPILDEALKGADFVEHVVVHRRRAPKAPLAAKEVDFEELAAAQSVDCEPERMDAEDPLFILYTSGTTGKPKGVLHTQAGFMVGTYYLSRMYYDIHEEDVYWSTSDIGWIVGHSYIVYGPLFAGGTVLVREGAPDYPDPGVIWRTVERHGVNLIFTAPTTLRMFMKFGAEALAPYDLRSLRVIACAGEPLNPEAWHWAQETIVGPHGGYVVDNYWQTEVASPMIATFPAMEFRPGKAGVPVPGVRLDIVDHDGNPVPDGKGGILVMRDPVPYMLRDVWGDPARYAKMWNTIPGVYHTGDIAVRDKDGYIAVLGRDDDVIKVAGHRFGTADIESALVQHPAVVEAAAVGLPDPIKGERIKAFVILAQGIAGDEKLREELGRHVRAELGPVAVVSEIEFADKLPKTRSGKIVRRFLKAKELGQDPGDLSTLED